MLRRVIIIGLVSIGLSWVMGGTAEAACPPFCIGGFSVTGINSVEVDSILRGLKKADVTNPLYEVFLVVEKGIAICRNKGGQSDTANGIPFEGAGVLLEGQTDKDFVITKNGRALSEIIYENPEILALFPDLACQNRNWSVEIPIVTEAEVVGFLFSCDDVARTSCTLEDTLGKQCVAPTDDIDVLLGIFSYDCATICDGPPGDPATCDSLEFPIT